MIQENPPRHVILSGCHGTGKSVVLENVLELKLASYKLIGVIYEVLLIVYHWNVGEESSLLLEMEKQYAHLGIKPMTFIDACKGTEMFTDDMYLTT